MGGLCCDLLTCLGLSNHVTLRLGKGNIKSCRKISRYLEEHRVRALCCKGAPHHFFLKYLGLFEDDSNIQRLCIIQIYLSYICQQRLCAANPDQQSGCIQFLPSIFHSLKDVLPTKSLVFSWKRTYRRKACDISIKPKLYCQHCILLFVVCGLTVVTCRAQINCRWMSPLMC